MFSPRNLLAHQATMCVATPSIGGAAVVIGPVTQIAAVSAVLYSHASFVYALKFSHTLVRKLASRFRGQAVVMHAKESSVGVHH